VVGRSSRKASLSLRGLWILGIVNVGVEGVRKCRSLHSIGGCFDLRITKLTVFVWNTSKFRLTLNKLRIGIPNQIPDQSESLIIW
jgi:hypothetical protein